MSEKIVVPTLGESVTEATVAKWYKNEGDSVTLDEPLLELETDKVTLEVPLFYFSNKYQPKQECLDMVPAKLYLKNYIQHPFNLHDDELHKFVKMIHKPLKPRKSIQK